MAEIKLSFDITISRRFLTASATAAMMLCAVPELDSESVTLSTYYPAPSGVYTNMITTANTYLSRDSGSVGIGTASPTAGTKLHVNGNFQTNRLEWTGVGGNSATSGVSDLNGNYATYQAPGGWGGSYPDLNVRFHTGISYDAYYGYGGHRFYTGWPGGNLPPAGNGVVTGNGPTLSIDDAVRAGVPIVYTGPNCTLTTYGAGITNCPGGRYASFTGGYMAKQTTSIGSTDPGGTMLCCPCPVAGCPLL